MSERKFAVSVSCSKVKSIRKQAEKNLYFSLTVTWSDNTKSQIDRPYSSIHDLKLDVIAKCEAHRPNIDCKHLELKEAKWFERTFFLHNDRKAIDDFFSKVLKLPEVISRSEFMQEFFEKLWTPPSKKSNSGKSNDKVKTEESREEQNCSSGSSTISSNSSVDKTPRPHTKLGSAYEEVYIEEHNEYDQLNLRPGRSFSAHTDEEPRGAKGGRNTADGVDEKYLIVVDYRKRKSGEVDLEQGGAVTVIQSEFTGWWFVQVEETREQGWAPASCLLPANRKSTIEEVHVGPSDVVPKQMVTCRDYQARSGDELSFKKGDTVEILQARTDGWWKVRCGDQEGLVPEAYLECISQGEEEEIYRHVSICKKSSPPPRRHFHEPIEELYARVEEIQRKKKEQKKITNQLDESMEEDYAAYSEIPPEPTSTSMKTARVALYEEIPPHDENWSVKKKSPSAPVKSESSHSTGKPLPPVPFSRLFKNKSDNSNSKSSAKKNAISDAEPTAGSIQGTKAVLGSQISAGTYSAQIAAVSAIVQKELLTQINSDPETGPFRLKPVSVPVQTTGSTTSSTDRSTIKAIMPTATYSKCPQVVVPPVLSIFDAQSRVKKDDQACLVDSQPIRAEIQNTASSQPVTAETQSTAPPSPTQASKSVDAPVKPKVDKPKPPSRNADTSLTAKEQRLSSESTKSNKSNSSATKTSPAAAETPEQTSVNPSGGSCVCVAHGMAGDGSSDNQKSSNRTTGNLQNDQSPGDTAVATKLSVHIANNKPIQSADCQKVSQSSKTIECTSFSGGTVSQAGTPRLSNGSPPSSISIPLSSGKPERLSAGAKCKLTQSMPNSSGGQTKEVVDPPMIQASLIDRVTCETMLRNSGKSRDYILRQSSKPGSFVISVLWQDRVRHFPIKLTADNKYYIGKHSFTSVADVIGYYITCPIFEDDKDGPIMLGEQFVPAMNEVK